MSLADTLTMPFASMSKVTSICGTPRRRRRQPGQVELAERTVVARHRPPPWSTCTSTLVWLSAAVENVSLARRNRRVARNQRRHDPAERLDPERERRHVEQQ